MPVIQNRFNSINNVPKFCRAIVVKNQLCKEFSDGACISYAMVNGWRHFGLLLNRDCALFYTMIYKGKSKLHPWIFFG